MSSNNTSSSNYPSLSDPGRIAPAFYIMTTTPNISSILNCSYDCYSKESNGNNMSYNYSSKSDSKKGG